MTVSAGAQTISPSFEQLPRFVKPGENVFVVDTAGQEIWARVVEVSQTALTVALMERSKDGSRLITGDRRTFHKDTVSMILRSDAAGAKGSRIYPASWHKVQALRPETTVAVVLETGERRNYRVTAVEADRLQLLTSAGQRETLEKSRVSKVLRRGFDDPVGNGVLIGALAGAGTAVGLIAIATAGCGPNCNEPENETALRLTFTAFGTGIGALVGWVVDRIHKGDEVLFPAAPGQPTSMSVSPILTGGCRGASFSIRF